jgi:hypothetical protein
VCWCNPRLLLLAGCGTGLSARSSGRLGVVVWVGGGQRGEGCRGAKEGRGGLLRTFSGASAAAAQASASPTHPKSATNHAAATPARAGVRCRSHSSQRSKLGSHDRRYVCLCASDSREQQQPTSGSRDAANSCTLRILGSSAPDGVDGTCCCCCCCCILSYVGNYLEETKLRPFK